MESLLPSQTGRTPASAPGAWHRPAAAGYVHHLTPTSSTPKARRRQGHGRCPEPFPVGGADPSGMP